MTYKPDRLRCMLIAQEQMQRQSFGHDVSNMTPEEKVDYIRWNVLALEDELHEALNETSWKPWTNGSYIYTKNFKGELIDAWHFLMNLFTVAGMDADEIEKKYNEKHQKNRERQSSGQYDGVMDKCPSCKRELDKPGALRVSRRIAGNGTYVIAMYDCIQCDFTLDPKHLTEDTKNGAVEW